MPISGVLIDWCAPPSGAKAQARWRADQQEARILVTAIVQRIEAAGDERIVDRADRDQPRAEVRRRQARARRASGRSCSPRCPVRCAGRRHARPISAPRDFGGLEHVLQLAAAEQPAPVDEAAKVGRLVTSGAVVTIRSPSGSPDFARSIRMRPNADCVDWWSPSGTGRRAGTGTGSARCSGGVAANGAAIDKRLEVSRDIVAKPAERLPFLPLGDIQAGAQLGDLGRVHHPGMIVLVPGERQPEALDRVGDEHGRPVVVGRRKGIDQRFDAMTAQIGHQPRQRRVVIAGEQLADAGRSPMSAISRARQAAPPWKVSAA